MRRIGRPLLPAAVVAAGLLLASCTTDRAGLPSSAPLPPSAPRVTGVERAAQREHQRLVEAFGGEYRWPAAQQMLEGIVARLVPATDEPSQSYRVTILDSPTVNAFALPTGNIYVTRGLLALANDSSEIAGVLAHEIAHVTARHATARAELEQRSALVSRVVAEVLNDPAAGEVMQDESRRTIAGFSRAQEFEADRIGIRTMARAGYDPYGAAHFLVSLGRNAQASPSAGARRGGTTADFLATHPSTPERIAQALKAAREIEAPGIGETRRADYLAAINGIAFGDNPADGVIRGRRFLHPRLGITFTAPEGFFLDNTAQAVLGVGPGGDQALRLDAVEVPTSESLEDFLASGWIEGIVPGSIVATTVNGLPAATAVAGGKEWTFRVAAVRIGTSVYRLVLASRGPDVGSARAFRETIDSLRQLTPGEIRDIKPLRIEVAVARAGDTAERLAARMGLSDHQLERFLVLNGLDRGGALTPGERYKLIVE